MTSAGVTGLAVAMLALVSAMPAGAGDCEAAKLQAAGRYGACRLVAESRARTSARPPVVAGCDDRFARRWAGIEQRDGGSCPTLGDVVATRDAIVDHVAEMASGADTGLFPTCTVDLTACDAALASCLDECADALPAALVATGQDRCWDTAGTEIPCAGTGQDGERQLGLPPAYADNGDGTISDLRTGLMWEKLGRGGDIHDVDTLYTWEEAFAKTRALNQSLFAGHGDWRLPNVIELMSLVSFVHYDPAIDPLFATGCQPGCSIDACSCTASELYWSSTTYADGDYRTAFTPEFRGGRILARYKSISSWRVRAVRGGQ